MANIILWSCISLMGIGLVWLIKTIMVNEKNIKYLCAKYEGKTSYTKDEWEIFRDEVEGISRKLYWLTPANSLNKLDDLCMKVHELRDKALEEKMQSIQNTLRQAVKTMPKYLKTTRKVEWK